MQNNTLKLNFQNLAQNHFFAEFIHESNCDKWFLYIDFHHLKIEELEHYFKTTSVQYSHKLS